MVKCPRCGYENEATDIYCRNCTYPLQDPNTNFTKKRQRNKSWNIGTGKKILIVIGIIIIAFLLFTLVYNISQPAQQKALNVVTSPDSTHQSSSNPYKINISSNSSWYIEINKEGIIETMSGQGDRIISLDSASWDNITVKVTKTSSNSDTLKIQLLKNGNVIAKNETSDAQKTLTLHS